MNHVVLIGRITHDLDLQHVGDNVPVVNFAIAVNRFKDDEADFIRVVAWRKQAENLVKYMSKGSLIAVSGNLRVENYETAEGEKRTSVKVVADRVQFLDKGKGKSQSDDTVDEGEDVPW